MKQQRLPELDSLRGIAALIVVFFHLLLLTVFCEVGESQSNNILDMLFNYSPLVILNSGHQSVILFFVLSGFVLYLSYSRSANFRYSSYITRRFCRLYIPYITSVFFGFFMQKLLSMNGIMPLWGTAITAEVVVNHLLPLGMFSQNSFNPVIWSLVQEMRISFVLPFVFYFIRKYSWRTALCTGFILSFIGITLHSIYTNVDSFTNYFDTLHYLLIFIIGAILAKHLSEIQTFINNLSAVKKFFALFIGFICYGYPGSFTFYVARNTTFQYLLRDWFIAIGCVVFIITALSAKTASAILRIRPLIYLGRISYSIYLTHLIILYSLLSAAPVLGLTLSEVWIYTIIGTLVLSNIFYLLIEKPSTKFSKNMPISWIKSGRRSEQDP